MIPLVRMKQLKYKKCLTLLIKKWIIFAKLVPLNISSDETIIIKRLFNRSNKKVDNFCKNSSLEYYSSDEAIKF